MVNAVMLSIPDSSFSEIPLHRYLDVHASPTDHGSWIGVDYLILCTQNSPVWVAKIDVIALPRVANAPLRVSFSDVRSLVKKREHPECPDEIRNYRYNGGYAKLIGFESEAFFRIGDSVPFIAQPKTLGPLNMEKAVLSLAETYGVNPEQIEITIRSKPIETLQERQK